MRIKPFKRGWVVETPFESRDKNGNAKTSYREAFFPRLDQSLRYVIDEQAKDCTDAQELLIALQDAELTINRVLRQNGLVDSPKRVAG